MPDPCTLTADPIRRNWFTTTAGMITLTINDLVGTSTFSTLSCVVWDVTVLGTHTSVPSIVTDITLSFSAVSGKTYYVRVMLRQLPDPLTASAALMACGTTLATIDSTNEISAYYMVAA